MEGAGCRSTGQVCVLVVMHPGGGVGQFSDVIQQQLLTVHRARGSSCGWPPLFQEPLLGVLSSFCS